MDLPCIVEFVRFRNDSGFAILGCNLNAYSPKYTPELEDVVKKNIKSTEYDNFTVTIGILNAHEKPEGRQYIFVGDFFKHPKFGDQFKAEYYYQDEINNQDGMQIYLMSLPNIKEARSKAIIEKFSVDEILDILENDPHKLTVINGITENRIPAIKEAWDRDKSLRELYIWLGEHKIPLAIANKAYDKWKDKSLDVLTTNPYRLMEIRGIGFVIADSIAHKIFDKVSIKDRTVACIQHILMKNLYEDSNLCLPYKILRINLEKLLKKSNESNDIKSDIKENLALVAACIKENLNLFTVVKDLINEENVEYVYLKDIWDKEKYISENIYHRKAFEKKRGDCSDKDIEDAQKDVSKFSGREIVLDDCQREAIKSAFEHKITVITGPGGTGKSTIARCIYYLAAEKKLTIRMMTPTGKAAQVLSDKTHCGAATIHRSLKLRPEDEFPREEIREDIVLVDEVSMVGIDTMFAVICAMENNLWGNIVFVGDPNQLPSVSPGNFLSDIIKSGCANVVKLNKIHRQDENSYIPLLANKISSGKIVEIPENACDIKWHNIGATDEFDVAIKMIIKDFIKDNDIDDLQVVAPMYKGNCGVNRINVAMQEVMVEINGTQDNFIQRNFSKFYLKDRVIQTVNNYEKEIFNGDMGKIIDIGRRVVDPSKSDQEVDYIKVNFYGDEIIYVDNEIEQLKLAFCCTVHKMQGSQFPNVIFVMAQEAQIMMSKELVYTAFTRAEKHLDIYGHMVMLRLAPTKSVIRKRYTNVSNIIKGLRENTKTLKVYEEVKPANGDSKHVDKSV